MKTEDIPFMDVNGLEDGNIPPATPCPFIEGCRFRADTCPSEKFIRVTPFSCAVARLMSFAKSISDSKGDPDEKFF